LRRDIPSLVKAVRRTHGLTQEKLAQALGVTFSTVNAWENGRHRPIPLLVAALERMALEGSARSVRTSVVPGPLAGRKRQQ
jgi:DNA-binding XRE family transcriptional regulator